jgi:hypothetical protein
MATISGQRPVQRCSCMERVEATEISRFTIDTLISHFEILKIFRTTKKTQYFWRIMHNFLVYTTQTIAFWNYLIFHSANDNITESTLDEKNSSNWHFPLQKLWQILPSMFISKKPHSLEICRHLKNHVTPTPSMFSSHRAIPFPLKRCHVW